MEASGEKHWVEKLFPAKYGLTLEDILNDELPTEDGDEEPGTLKKQDSVFTKLAYNVSPLDVAGIKNVYERVWMMKHLEDEEKRKDEKEMLAQKLCHKTMKKVLMKHMATSTDDFCDHIDIQDPCIWNSNEIHVLRSVFKIAKEQNKKLRVNLFDAQDQLEKLQVKHDKDHSELDVKSVRLKEAVKANQRLNILTKNLKSQVDSATKQINGFRLQIAEMKSSRQELLKEVHELRVLSDHERLDCKKAELALQHYTSEALRERRVHEENLKFLHEEDIQFLQNTIDDVSDELLKEKKDHDRTKRGLNHLRQHFSSLSMHEETLPEGSVRDDQLKNFTY